MHGDIRTYLWVPQRPPLEAPKIWAKKETDIGTYLWVPQRPPLEAPKNEADVRIYLWVPQRHRLEAPKNGLYKAVISLTQNRRRRLGFLALISKNQIKTPRLLPDARSGMGCRPRNHTLSF